MNRSTSILWLVCLAVRRRVRARPAVGAEFGSAVDCRGGRMPLANGHRLDPREGKRSRHFDDVIHDAGTSEGSSGETARHSAISADRRQPLQSRVP